ncbi:MAG: serine/threonine protein kinase, partial [Myxococcales bacterium]|nr:serine/threonine protein kinase [Myxococcales bacterium]
MLTTTWRTALGPNGLPIVEGREDWPPPRPVLKLPDRYQDRGFLAAGAVGEIRRVHDTKLATELVMKICRRGATTVQRRRFEREARLTARLHHPNILPALDLGVFEDNTPWFTMPEVRGRTLREVITELLAMSPQERARPQRRVIELVEEVAQALGYAHEQGVAHRDVKPENLMVGRFGDVRVMDFGVAMDLRTPEDELDDAVVGTPLYMAPEQARGEIAHCGPTMDVYALGVMLYQVLTGSTPYEGDGVQVWHQVVEGPPPDPADRLRPGFDP